MVSFIFSFIRGSDVTKLKVGITVTHIDIDEKTDTFTAFGWTKMMWTDDRLKWNSSDYGGRGLIHMMEHEIW